MRDDRLVALRALGARLPASRSLPVVTDGAAMIDVSERGGGSPAESPSDRSPPRVVHRETERNERVRLAGHIGAGTPWSTYRIRFTKVGRSAFLGHLDLARLIERSFRRADLLVATTRGFAPKPRITFGPALGLGIPSLGELMDVDLEHVVPGMRPWDIPIDVPRAELSPDSVRERLAAVCPPGIEILACTIVRLAGHKLASQPDLGLGKLIDAVDLVIRPAGDGMAHDATRLGRIATAFAAKSEAKIARGDKTIDVRALVIDVGVIEDEAATKLTAALDWPSGPLLSARVRATAEGSAKPSEVARALGVWGSDDPRADHALVARLGVVEASARPHSNPPR